MYSTIVFKVEKEKYKSILELLGIKTNKGQRAIREFKIKMEGR